MKKITLLSSALLMTMSIQPTSATVLTFSNLENGRGGEILNYAIISQMYGDNVVTTTTNGIGSYLKGSGFTPNITTSYSATNAATGEILDDYVAYWSGGYSDLEGVAIARQNNHYVEITLTPENGYTVVLDSFDMASWSQVDRSLKTLQVLSANRAVLWNSGVNIIHGKNDVHDTFAPNISSTGAITIRWGTDYNIGIDNISFHQRLTNSIPAAHQDCTVQYNTDGTLVIPCVSVPSGAGETIYQAIMKMVSPSAPMTFELISAGTTGAVSNACMARYQLNGRLELPCVSLPDGSTYTATMQIKPLSTPMRFELVDAQKK
jgi:hypothetical protein